jgi:hypothetical protein
MTRNTMVHGKNQVARQEAQRRITEADLRSVYDNREKLEPDLQRLLFRDVQDHIERHPTCVTRNWLQTNAPILQESLRRAKRQALKGVRSIRSYFAPVRWFRPLEQSILDATLLLRVVSSRVGRPPGRERSGSTLTWYLVFFVFFVIHATLGTCLHSFKVDDNAWNEIMAMAIRMQSSFLMIGTNRCTNVSVENWHGCR